MSEWVADIERIADEIHNAYEEGYANGKRDAVVHGHWIRGGAYPHHIFCSNCYRTYVPNDESEMWKDWTRLPRKYCPECGTKMDEVTE